MRFYIDIEDANGNKLGSGPITSASAWRVRTRMDGAGEWSFAAPLADVKLAQATPRRYAHIYAYVDGAYAWVGGGPIDSIQTQIADDGIITATVSGADLLRELTWRSVGNLELSDGAGGPMTHSQAVSAVAALAPAGWTITADAAPGHDQIYGQFGGESVLAALLTLAERSQSHLILTGRRTAAFVAAVTASGVHGVAAEDDLGEGQCAIVTLGRESSAYDMVSRIIPIGAGQSLAALTLRATTRTAAAGYTLDAANNWLRNDAVETQYGRCERTVAFKDIAPLSSTTADVRSAANMLYDAALAWLNEHAAPVETYRLSVAECPALLRPLQSVRISYQNPAQNLTLDESLIVLAVEWSGDPDGVRTAGLTVATADQWPEGDIDALVGGLAEGTIYQAYPQLNANDLVIPYAEPVDETEQAEFWWRFDDHVTQLVRVVFDFELRPLESTVKTVALEQSTGGTISTSFAGNSGATSASNSGTPSVSNTGDASVATTSGQTGGTTTDSGGSGSTGSGGSGSTGSGGSGNTGSGGSGNTGSGGSGTSGGSGQLETDEPDGTDWSGGSHRHSTRVFDISSPSGAPVYLYSTGGTYYFGAPTGNGSQYVATEFVGNHTHAIDGHTHTVPNHTHTIAAHSHTVPDHTHTMADHTHTMAAHTHTMAAHSHTLNQHTHDIGHTHTISHTHDISHTHTFTPAVTTIYGIFRDSAANTFALADLEYSLDGATWYGFAVGVNGWTSLGGNRYRVNLTALLQDATTLRPLNENNLLRIRRKSTGATGKKATIKAQLGVRTIIQALALT